MAVADLARFKEVLANDQIKSVVVILAQDLNLDGVAGGLTLAQALEKRGLAVTISAPSPMTVEFNRLVGINRVRQDLGDKNLILSFTNYPADNIEKVSYNIENGQFALTVIPKPGNKAPGKEHISLNYAGISADLIIVVGANYPEGLGVFSQNKELIENLGKNLVLFGNTPLSGWPKSIELIDASGVSISQAAFEVIQSLGVAIDEDLATNLFSGLEAGTANFTSPTVGVETFALATDLLKAGAKRAPAQTETSLPFPTQPATSPRQTVPEDLASFKDSSSLG